jgi:hypothetical protein
MHVIGEDWQSTHNPTRKKKNGPAALCLVAFCPVPYR